MRLGVNGLRLTGARLGVGRYVEYMVRYWPGVEHGFDPIRVYLPGLPADLEARRPVEFHTLSPSRPRNLWEHAVLPLRKEPDDLFFCPSYVVPLLNGDRPVVVTHHGSYEAIPEAFSFWNRTRARLAYQASCRRADLVITVSESSRRDIVRFYGVPRERIRVIPEGVDDAFRPLEDAAVLTARRKAYFPDGRPYVLFVGKLSRRRNIPALLEGFARLVRRRGLPHGLVLIGPDTSGQDAPRLAEALGIADRLHHAPYAGHGELVEAYNAADVFVYPSSYEGFGIPVLEAMACGTPSVTLHNSAFPEFAGGIAHFADDASPAGLEAALETALESDEFRERARREGPRRADGYRWRRIAARTIRLLEEVARSGGVPAA